MGALILSLLFGWSVFAGPLPEVELGGNFFDVTKAMSAIDRQAPEYLRTIEGLLRETCTPGKSLLACSFMDVAKAHAQAFADWRAIAQPQNPYEISPILFRPRWTDADVRAGSWNVAPNDAEALAAMSAMAATRYLVTQIALRKSFDDVADWMRTWGNPSASFQAVIRPSVSAFLNSGNSLGQMGDFALNMNCLPTQIACRAVRVRMGQFLVRQAADLAPVIAELSSRANVKSELAEVYNSDSAFRSYVESNWQALLEIANQPERLRAIAQVNVYIEFLAKRAVDRKNLMPGRYSMADEILAVIVLSDLERARRKLDLLAPSFESELPKLSADSEKAVQALEVQFQKQFKPYRDGLMALLAAPGA